MLKLFGVKALISVLLGATTITSTVNGTSQLFNEESKVSKPKQEIIKIETSKPIVKEQPTTNNQPIISNSDQDKETINYPPMAPSDTPVSIDGSSIPLEEYYLFEDGHMFRD